MKNNQTTFRAEKKNLLAKPSRTTDTDGNIY